MPLKDTGSNLFLWTFKVDTKHKQLKNFNDEVQDFPYK